MEYLMRDMCPLIVARCSCRLLLVPGCLLQSLPLLLALTGAAGGLYYAKENGLLDGFTGVPAPVKVWHC